MAGIVMATVTTTIGVESLPLQTLSEAYAANPDSAERALPTPEPDMQQVSEIRNRGPAGPAARSAVGNNESSPESSQILTPSSSDDHQQTQGTCSNLEDSSAIGYILAANSL